MQQCAHCRFRKTVFIFKALARTKIVSKEPRVNQISAVLHLNSQDIVKYCMNNMGKEWGANYITEFREHEEQDKFEKQEKNVKITEKVQKLQQTVRIVSHRKLDVDKLQLNKMFSSFNK